MEVLNDILGYKNRKIFQNDQFFSFSLDSVILANFARIRYSDKKILDLGTGNGIIPLILSLKTKQKIVGVEIQEKLALMAEKSICYNNLQEQISIINCDMKEYVSSDTINTFDFITCNPPYFEFDESSTINLSLEKAIARHEIKIKLAEIILIARKLLKNNGKFAMVHRTDRLFEILDLFKKNKIEPKRIRFIYDSSLKESSLFFIEGSKNGKTGLTVEKPMILYNLDGSMTDEYKTMIEEV